MEISWRLSRAACALVVLGVVAVSASPAQTFTTLVTFDGNNGQSPHAGLVQGLDGFLYGTTSQGGSDNAGVVYTLTPAGAFSLLYTFTPTSGGKSPYSTLIQATDGNLYGTTYFGGDPSCGGGVGCGAVFSITPGGILTNLHSFTGADGSNPTLALVEAANGNFYGVAQGGGPSPTCGREGCGIIFKVTSGGVFTTLHHFTYTDGQYPSALVQAFNGNLYGVTSKGGAYSVGTVFQLAAAGALTTLYSFPLSMGFGSGGLVQGADGNLYGTAISAGADGCATVFKITPTGALTTLHNFAPAEGCAIASALVAANDGNFYGTAISGGSTVNCPGGCGTIFKITPAGKLTLLHSFQSTDGYGPGGLMQATDGNFYGTTPYGGPITGTCYAPYECGTVFRLSAGLEPFVKMLPVAGGVGTTVNILGTNLTGASGVTFHGTPAPFTVISPSLITATVPAGATTGKVQVALSGYMLSSNTVFQVRRP